MTTRVVGALALEYLSDAGAIGVSTRKRAALADLRALMAQAETYRAERDRLRAALLDLLHANGSGPKSCGHAFHCACPYDASRAALAECGSSSVASRPAGELGGGK